MQDSEEANDNDVEYGPSKSARKRDMQALQETGKRLTTLKPGELAQIPLPDTLAKAILDYNKISSHEAKRRQLQFIGKLMRGVEPDEIDLYLQRFSEGSQQQIERHHETEQWRTKLIENSKTALNEFISQFPNADIQHLRQLIRNARKDLQAQKNRGAGKKLYRHLREIIDKQNQKGE